MSSRKRKTDKRLDFTAGKGPATLPGKLAPLKGKNEGHIGPKAFNKMMFSPTSTEANSLQK